MYAEHREARTDFLIEFDGRCAIRGRNCQGYGASVHEMTRGKNRKRAFGVRAAWLPACGPCNCDDLGSAAEWPLARQLWLKLKIDLPYFDLAEIRRILAPEGCLNPPIVVTAEDIAEYGDPPAGKAKDLRGRRFGRLVAVGWIGVDAYRYGRWACICDCGKGTVAHSGNLKQEAVSSCGCSRVTHGKSETNTFEIWAGMLSRCRTDNPNHFRYYKGRGVTVCERWAKFENFLADMGERPEGMSIDRYPNPHGNYEPGNCRWATPKQQRANQRSKHK